MEARRWVSRSVPVRWKNPIEWILRHEMRNIGRQRYTTLGAHVTTATRSEGFCPKRKPLSLSLYRIMHSTTITDTKPCL